MPRLENRPDCIYFGAAGHVLGTAPTLRDRFIAYTPSRAQLEWQIRRRVAAIDNVEIWRRAVTEPHMDAGAQRVTGVFLDGGEPDLVAADLVVDAAGRSTRLPVWLDQWGYHRPRTDTVDVGIGYASQWFRIPEGLIPERIVVCGASRQQPLGLGMQGGRHLGSHHLWRRQSHTTKVPSAALVARAFRHNMRLWLAQRRSQRPRPVTS